MILIFFDNRDQQNRELRDSFIQIMNQYILTHFGEVVSKVINIEIQRQLAPMLSAKIDHVQQQLQIDVSQKLTTFDLMLNENISQICKSKVIMMEELMRLANNLNYICFLEHN